MSAFNVVKAEFGSFEIDCDMAWLGWRYSIGSQNHKYCDGCSIRLDEKDSATLISRMAMTSLHCEKSNEGLNILYSNGIPVAYKILGANKWNPFTHGWHKKRLEKYLGGKQ